MSSAVQIPNPKPNAGKEEYVLTGVEASVETVP